MNNCRITREIDQLIHVELVLRKRGMKQKLQGLLTPNPLICPLSLKGETRQISWPKIQTPSHTLSLIKLLQIIIALLTSTN